MLLVRARIAPQRLQMLAHIAFGKHVQPLDDVEGHRLAAGRTRARWKARLSAPTVAP